MPASGMDKIKTWMFPGLITALATMLWYDIREIKSDIKVLIAQTNIDKTRIDNLEREVYEYHTNKPTSNSSRETKHPFKELVFLKPEEYYNQKTFKPHTSSND
jgi:hypothetical protein